MTPFNWALGGSSGSVKTSMVADVMVECAKSGHVGTVTNSQMYTIAKPK